MIKMENLDIRRTSVVKGGINITFYIFLPLPVTIKLVGNILARDSIMQSALYAIAIARQSVRPSVRPSVRQTGGS